MYPIIPHLSQLSHLTTGWWFQPIPRLYMYSTTVNWYQQNNTIISMSVRLAVISWSQYVTIIFLGKLSYFTNLNLAAIWGSFPILTMISSEGEQWGRYNLPRYLLGLNTHGWPWEPLSTWPPEILCVTIPGKPHGLKLNFPFKFLYPLVI